MRRPARLLLVAALLSNVAPGCSDDEAGSGGGTTSSAEASTTSSVGSTSQSTTTGVGCGIPAPGHDWTCVGSPDWQWPEPSTPSAHVTLTLSHLTSPTDYAPLVGADVLACDASDPTCAMGVAFSETSGAICEAEIPLGVAAFSGFFRLVHPEMRETLMFVQPSIYADWATPWSLDGDASLLPLATSIGLTPDPSRGIVGVNVEDCSALEEGWSGNGVAALERLAERLGHRIAFVARDIVLLQIGDGRLRIRLGDALPWAKGNCEQNTQQPGDPNTAQDYEACAEVAVTPRAGAGTFVARRRRGRSSPAKRAWMTRSARATYAAAPSRSSHAAPAGTWGLLAAPALRGRVLRPAVADHLPVAMKHRVSEESSLQSSSNMRRR